MEKCRKMREAKERKRLAEAVALEPYVCGVVTFEGPAFGGTHCVRFVSAGDARHVRIEVDGIMTCVKTVRGARALVSRRIGNTGRTGRTGPTAYSLQPTA